MSDQLEEPNCNPKDQEAIRGWLGGFAAAVRARDFVAGRALCRHDVFSFGTVADRASGLDSLESDQWRRVWGITTGFAFELEALRCGGEGELFWIAVPWSSRGQHKPGGAIERRGRATIILRKFGDTLQAVHTHFSLVPARRLTPSEGSTS